MRVVLFTDAAGQGTSGALQAEGISLDRWDLPPAIGSQTSGALVAGFRDAETTLSGEPPEAVLVAGTGDGALAAALTAVKLQIPTGWLRQADSPEDALIARVADASLDATAPAADLAAQVRDLAARRIPAP